MHIRDVVMHNHQILYVQKHKIIKDIKFKKTDFKPLNLIWYLLSMLTEHPAFPEATT